MPVGKGRNDFVVTSTDLETGRDSVGLQVIADVPVGSVVDPDARPTPALPSGASSESLGGTPTAQVAIAQPKNKATARNGVVKLRGTSDAPSVLVSFQWLGDADAAPPAPDPVELEVVEGTYKGSFTLPKGRWQVSAAAPDGAFTTTTGQGGLREHRREDHGGRWPDSCRRRVRRRAGLRGRPESSRTANRRPSPRPRR